MRLFSFFEMWLYFFTCYSCLFVNHFQVNQELLHVVLYIQMLIVESYEVFRSKLLQSLIAFPLFIKKSAIYVNQNFLRLSWCATKIGDMQIWWYFKASVSQKQVGRLSTDVMNKFQMLLSTQKYMLRHYNKF